MRISDWSSDVCSSDLSIGGSMNLFAHPIKEIRQIADEVGAIVLFDAAHMSGMIAGKAWQQPLQEGAHLMTMSTYKSLGGHAGGLIVTNDAALAKKLEAIAFPGLRSEEHTSELQSLMRISYAVFCLKKNKTHHT